MTSPPSPVHDKSSLEAIRAEALRIEEDATYSAKRQFEAHDIWDRRHLWIGLPAVILSVAAGASVLAKAWPMVAAIVSLLVAVLTALLTFLKPSERAAGHKAAGDQYLSLRNDARVFRTIDLVDGRPVNELAEAVRTLSKRRNELNGASPQTPRAAFNRARKGIEEGEAKHEIDHKR